MRFPVLSAGSEFLLQRFIGSLCCWYLIAIDRFDYLGFDFIYLIQFKAV